MPHTSPHTPKPRLSKAKVRMLKSLTNMPRPLAPIIKTIGQHRPASVRLAVLVWITVWFVLIVPAHNRGAIKTPGNNADTAGARQPVISAGGCAMCKAPLGEPDEPDGEDSPAPAPGGDCAICYINAVITIPPPVVLIPPVVEVQRAVNVATPQSPHCTRPPLPIVERGPPTA